MLSPLEGIITPMITPLNKESGLDMEGLDRLIDHLLAGGVNGLFILGTTGECTNISYETRIELIQKTCKKVNGALPVLVGITDTSIKESLALAEVSSQAGAAALVAAPPYYYALGEPELEAYFTELADRVSLPLFLYNMPSHTKTFISQKTVCTLSAHPNIFGLKDSSGNSVYFNSLLYAFREQPDFSLLVGPEEMMSASVLMGANGGVSGGSNMFPALYVDLYKAGKSGDLDEVAVLQEMVMEISSEIYNLGTYGSSYLKGLKAAMSILGITQNHLATPLSAFEDKQIQAIEIKIKKLKALKKYGSPRFIEKRS